MASHHPAIASIIFSSRRRSEHVCIGGFMNTSLRQARNCWDGRWQEEGLRRGTERPLTRDSEEEQTEGGERG
eukprot:760894-Hanusia_phi.AAC.4